MAEVTGFTSQRMREIEDTTVVDGEVQGDNLILLQRNGVPIDAGNVRGPQGDQGVPGPVQKVNDQLGNVYTPRAFATVAALNTDWPTAPEGAHAYVLADKSAYVKSLTGWVLAPHSFIFADKATLDTAWANAPVGSRAVTTDTWSVWEKNTNGWHQNNGYRVFANITELNARWGNAPTGSHAVTLDNNTEWYKNPTAWNVGNGVRVFNTQAERNARWPSPPHGATCITTDTFTIWVWDGGSWIGGVTPRRDSLVGYTSPRMGGDWPAPGDGTTEWIGNSFTAPSWANKMYVRVDLAGMRPSDATNLIHYRGRVQQGGLNDQFGEYVMWQGFGANWPHAHGWGDYFTVLPGQFRYSVLVSLAGGTVLKANPSSTFRYQIHYTP